MTIQSHELEINAHSHFKLNSFLLADNFDQQVSLKCYLFQSVQQIHEKCVSTMRYSFILYGLPTDAATRIPPPTHPHPYYTHIQISGGTEIPKGAKEVEGGP